PFCQGKLITYINVCSGYSIKHIKFPCCIHCQVEIVLRNLGVELLNSVSIKHNSSSSRNKSSRDSVFINPVTTYIKRPIVVCITKDSTITYYQVTIDF